MRGTFIAWHGVAKPIGADLASCPQFRFEDQRKKGLRREILGSVLTLTRFFSFWKVFLLTLGGTSSILGGTCPKMHFRGTGPVTFFWGTILAWGAQAVFWGARPQNVPMWRRACLIKYLGSINRNEKIKTR